MDWVFTRICIAIALVFIYKFFPLLLFDKVSNQITQIVDTPAPTKIDTDPFEP